MMNIKIKNKKNIIYFFLLFLFHYYITQSQNNKKLIKNKTDSLIIYNLYDSLKKSKNNIEEIHINKYYDYVEKILDTHTLKIYDITDYFTTCNHCNQNYSLYLYNLKNHEKLLIVLYCNRYTFNDDIKNIDKFLNKIYLSNIPKNKKLYIIRKIFSNYVSICNSNEYIENNILKKDK